MPQSPFTPPVPCAVCAERPGTIEMVVATQSGRRSHLRMLSLLRDSDLIRDARVDALALVEEDPELVEHPALAQAVAQLVDEERAEYLEKG